MPCEAVLLSLEGAERQEERYDGDRRNETK
jgi:hypothetical protein